MESLIKTYQIRIVTEQGVNPLTGEYWEAAEEEMDIDATSAQSAYIVAEFLCTLPFRGQAKTVLSTERSILMSGIKRSANEKGLPHSSAFVTPHLAQV